MPLILYYIYTTFDEEELIIRKTIILIHLSLYLNLLAKMDILEVLTTVKWVLSEIQLWDILLSFVGLFIFLSIYQRVTTKGPMVWPLVGMIPSFVRHANELHEWNSRALIACEGTYRYSGLWMCNCHGIVTSDPVKVEYMLKTNFNNFPKGTYYRERFGDLLGDGIFNTDGDSWKDQRRLATSQMHTTRFVEYSVRSMQKLVHEKLLPLIKKHACTSSQLSSSVDLQEWLLRFTFDNVCMVAFGVDSGCLALHLPEIPFAKAFEDATEYSLFRFLVPPFWWKLQRRLNFGVEKRLKQAVHIVHDFADKTVKNRKVDLIKTHHNDLLSRLIDFNQNGRFALSDKFLRDFCISFILAGRDTSSVALTWFFWLLHHHPQVETKILQEIEVIIKSRQQSIGGEMVFEASELEKMVYLEAALSETMRLYPPVPTDFKEAEEDDVYPDGMEVKKGGRVFYHVYAMGRMESIWGPNCHEFKPERWIKQGEFVSENQFKYAVFNAGPRLCVGKKFAYMQMKMVAASVLIRYRVKVKEGHPVSSKVTTTLYMKHGLQVTFLPRSIHH